MIYSILIEGIENRKTLTEILNDLKAKAQKNFSYYSTIKTQLYYLKEQQILLEKAISLIEPIWDQARKSFCDIMWTYLNKISKRDKNLEPSRILKKIREKVCEMYNVSYKNWWFFQDAYFNKLSFYSSDSDRDDLSNNKFVLLDKLVAKMKKSKYFSKCKCEETMRVYRWALGLHDLNCKTAQYNLTSKALKQILSKIILKQRDLSKINDEWEKIEKIIIELQEKIFRQ